MIEDLAKNIKCLREAKNISQSQLARIAGISNDYMNRIENSKVSNVGTEVVEAIAKALEEHPSMLLFGKVLEPELELKKEPDEIGGLSDREKELILDFRSIDIEGNKKNVVEITRSLGTRFRGLWLKKLKERRKRKKEKTK